MSHGLNQKNVLAAEISIRTGLEDLLLFRSSPSIWITYSSHAHGVRLVDGGADVEEGRDYRVAWHKG